MQPVRVPGKWKEHLKLHDFVRIDGAEYRIAQSMAAAAKKDAKRPGSASSVGSESINTSVRGDIFCTNAIIYCVSYMACLLLMIFYVTLRLWMEARAPSKCRAIRTTAPAPVVGGAAESWGSRPKSQVRTLFTHA